MELPDHRPTDVPVENNSLTRLFVVFVLIPTLLGAIHHLDHVIRGNHIGWPLVPEINAFTYSLAIYPLLAVSLYLTVTERVDARYWGGFFAFSAAMLAYLHLSPWAVEPPQDVIWPYANPVFGYLAFAVLLALIASVVIGSMYAAVLWRRDGSPG